MMLRMSVLKEAANWSSTSPCYAASAAADVPRSSHLRDREAVHEEGDLLKLKGASNLDCQLKSQRFSHDSRGGREHHQSKPES